MTEEECCKCDDDIKFRQQFQDEIDARFFEQISQGLRNYQIYSAMDLAWDAAPINKETYPLMLYAQGKMDLGKCVDSLSALCCKDKYVTKDDKGAITGINLPKFFEVNFNIVRSIITRRLAAQANKYNGLYPFYKYEARSTSQVGKVRADVLSQVMDIMTDQFGFRHHDVQVLRDAMLYGHSVDFVRAQWEREEQMMQDPDVNQEFAVEGKPDIKTVITKEGVGWINPHPSRVFWDNAYPLSSINEDMGCEFIGFWDIVRYGDVANNPKFWNRTSISYSSSMVNFFSTYAQYFSQYYCTIRPPCMPDGADLSAANDRKNNLGYYSQDMRGTALVLGNYFKKIVPKDWGIGKYPYPVWLRMLVAGDHEVMYAEFLPSSPAVYLGVNENDSRQMSISIGMELLPYQDQMTQLLSLLMLTMQSMNFKVLAIDVDMATPESIEKFRREASGKERYQTCFVLEYSGTKYRDLGLDPKQLITLIQTAPGQAITMIFQAMTTLVQLAERLLALSPHELGQPAPREITATETNMMAGTTETIYGFISDAVDEYRAAKKRILYESYMVCGDPNIRVPVLDRYSTLTIKQAGFDVLKEDEDPEEATIIDPALPKRHTIIGTKKNLNYAYVYSSRDGALRSVNTQSANVLTQLLGMIMSNPVAMQSIQKEKLYEIMNEIFRLSGAGVDLKLELQEGESNQIGPDKEQQMQQVLQQMVNGMQQDQQHLQALDQQVQQLMDVVKQLTAEVERIDNEPPPQPPQPPMDPLKVLKAHQSQEAHNLEMARGQQDLIHAQQDHSADMTLKGLKAAQEVKTLTTNAATP